jgi:hypothetical protein
MELGELKLLPPRPKRRPARRQRNGAQIDRLRGRLGKSLFRNSFPFCAHFIDLIELSCHPLFVCLACRIHPLGLSTLLMYFWAPGACAPRRCLSGCPSVCLSFCLAHAPPAGAFLTSLCNEPFNVCYEQGACAPPQVFENTRNLKNDSWAPERTGPGIVRDEMRTYVPKANWEVYPKGGLYKGTWPAEEGTTIR